MNTGIYKITNIINGKCYIGQSVNLKSRIKSHKSMLKHNNEDNPLLRKATKKYGYEKFEIEIIKYCKEEELDLYEQYYIDYYKSHKRENGYNIELGGSTHKHLSKEQIEKMKRNKKGKLIGKDNPFYGKHHTKETKERLSKIKKGNKNCVGRILSDETKQKIGEANKLQNAKAVECYNRNGDYIMEYRSISEACKTLNYKSSAAISQCCIGKRYTACNFQWKFKNDDKIITKLVIKRKNGGKPKKRILCVETNEIYESISEAIKDKKASEIWRVLKGERKTAGGYHWKYADDELPKAN